MDPNWINICAGVFTVITGIITIVNAFKPKSKTGSGAELSRGKSTASPRLAPVSPPKTATLNAVEPVPGVHEFSSNDKGYQDWVTRNPQGYVVNTYQDGNADQSKYLALHKASCGHVSNFDKHSPGAFTEGAYMKVCATDISSLEEWARAHGRSDGSFTGKCPCSPLAR